MPFFWKHPATGHFAMLPFCCRYFLYLLATLKSCQNAVWAKSPFRFIPLPSTQPCQNVVDLRAVRSLKILRIPIQALRPDLHRTDFFTLYKLPLVLQIPVPEHPALLQGQLIPILGDLLFQKFDDQSFFSGGFPMSVLLLHGQGFYVL